MTTIIAFTGSAGSGKDVTAKLMQNQMLHRDDNVKLSSMSFAAPIKLAVACILNCDVDCFDDRTFKEGSLLESHGLDTSPRQMMQLLGAEYGRQMIDPEIWIKTAHNTFMDACDARADFVFVTDLRYANEQAWVLENGGIVIHVDRQFAAPVATHASENGLTDLPCFSIDNNGSLADLATETLKLTRLIHNRHTPYKHRTSIDDCSPSEWDKVARNA